MAVRALRGAITVRENSREAILEASTELLTALQGANRITPQSLISVIFSATLDLDAVYPAESARNLGWSESALFCVQEMAVQESLPMCLRVLILWDTEKPQSQMRHCYLRDAASLRPDLAR